jgi:hypothetical protein
MRSLQIVAALFAVAASSAPTHAELVGHWTLDSDTSGLINLGADGATSDLTLMGAVAPTFSPTGGFDGGGYATFGLNAALVAKAADNAAADISASGGYPFSFSAWARSPQPAWTNFPRGTLMALSTPTSSGSFIQMSIGYGEDLDFETNRRNGGTTNLIDADGSGPLVTNGNWHHFAAVYSDPSTLQLYVDGILQPLSTDPNPVATVAYPTSIAAIGIGAFLRNTTTVQDYMRGDIDDPRLYNHALSLSEVRQLAGLIPGDFDGDKDVDGVDFAAWQASFPVSTGGTLAAGDSDGDGDVDGADFIAWQTHYPTTPVVLTSTVPEPMSLALTAIGSLIIGFANWNRQKRVVKV